MALIDVVKYEGSADTLVWKYPSDRISYAAQLIVNPSQEAVFCKEGTVFDILGPGAHSLETANIPLLQKAVNLPFGGDTPFPAEVFFLNKGIFKLTWGTKSPIAVEDPRYQITIGLKAYGSYIVSIHDTRTFLTKVAASRGGFTRSDADELLRPIVLLRLSDAIAEVVLQNNTSVTKVQQYLEETAAAGKTRLQPDFAKHGLELVEFLIESINFDTADPNFQRIQQILTDRFEIDTLGTDYARKRTLDIGQAAAENESPGAMQAGMGLGAGVGLGRAIATSVSEQLQGSASMAADPVARLAQLKKLLDAGLITAAEFDAKKREILAQM